ncbi:MAG: hypothetical protein RIG62_00215 [Cyclobacteriaceae bacterium]
MNSSIQNIAKAFAAASFGQIVNILSQILLVTFFLKSWGTQLYGEWLILSAMPSIIAMAGDLGFGTVAANEMSSCLARQDKVNALRVFENTWVIISCCSCVFVVIAIVVLDILPVASLLNISLLSERASVLIITLLLFRIIVGQQNSLLTAGLRCEGNYALGMFLNNTSKLLESVSVGIAIFLFEMKPISVAIIYFAISMMTWIVLRIVLNKKSPWIKYSFQNLSIGLIKQLLPTAMSYLSFPVINAISIQGVVTVIGVLLGPTAVVIFSTTRTFMNTLKQAVNIINLSVWAELTTAYAKNNYGKARKIFITSNRVVLSVVAVFNIFVFTLGKSLYEYWTKSEVDTSDFFFYFFSLVISINAIWSANSIVQVATNKARKMAILNMFSAFLLISPIIIFQKFMSLDAVLIVMLVSELFMFIMVSKDSLSILKLDTLSFYTGFLKTKSYQNSNS